MTFPHCTTLLPPHQIKSSKKQTPMLHLHYHLGEQKQKLKSSRCLFLVLKKKITGAHGALAHLQSTIVELKKWHWFFCALSPTLLLTSLRMLCGDSLVKCQNPSSSPQWGRAKGKNTWVVQWEDLVSKTLLLQRMVMTFFILSPTSYLVSFGKGEGVKKPKWREHGIRNARWPRHIWPWQTAF